MNRFTRETIKSWLLLKKEHVFINLNKLVEIARQDALLDDHLLTSFHDIGVSPFSNRAFLSHNFWNCVVDFASTHFDGSRRDGQPLKFRARTVFGEEVIGSIAIGACFYRNFGERQVLASDMLRHVETLSRMKKFFKGINSVPMIGERRELLIEACVVLEKYFGGDPRNLWEEGRFSAYGDGKSYLGIIEILKLSFPKSFGHDFCYWPPIGDWRASLISNSEISGPSSGGEPRSAELGGPLVFHFDKRANLAVVLYHGRAERFPQELPPIRDIHEVGPIPDFQVPRGYREHGVFRYSPELEEIILRRKLIERQSQFNIELRGATVFSQVIGLSLENLERKVLGLHSRHIGYTDHRWLTRGRSASYPQHFCKSIDY